MKKKVAEDKDTLKVKKFFSNLDLPEYALPTDVGFDLRACESVTLAPLEQKTVRTGIAVQIPEGHVGLIRDRAGIITKMGVHTAAGTFDPAYRGEVSIVLINFGEESALIESGMRIAQMVVIPVKRVKIKEVTKLDMTDRYDRGFGSTGNKQIIKQMSDLK